jgi:hypothetical protein
MVLGVGKSFVGVVHLDLVHDEGHLVAFVLEKLAHCLGRDWRSMVDFPKMEALEVPPSI